jgi:hypothetical protein
LQSLNFIRRFGQIAGETHHVWARITVQHKAVFASNRVAVIFPQTTSQASLRLAFKTVVFAVREVETKTTI